jgi:hypothetical protein
MQPDPTPEISQEAARAMLAALRDNRTCLEGHAITGKTPGIRACNTMLERIHTAIALAEGSAS